MERKPVIFIGSSAESLQIAEGLSKELSQQFEVKLWSGAFNSGEFFLERLRKELVLSDLALFILAPDDMTTKRGKQHHSVRDNVIFELGMFIGALGLKKAHFILVDTIRDGKKATPLTLSDLDGIKMTSVTIELDSSGKMPENPANTAALQVAAHAIADVFSKNRSGISLSLLPSTALGIGYFRNFIMQACKELSTRKDFQVGDKIYDLTKDIFDFYIIIPDTGNDASHEAYQKFVRRNDLIQVEIKSTNSPRTFPFFIRTEVKNGRIQLYDLPTTLLSSREIINWMLPTGNDAEEIEQLEIKEILNFQNTIRFLLNRPESAGFRDNIHMVSASELFRPV